MGLHHHRFFFLGLQPRSDGNSQHFAIVLIILGLSDRLWKKNRYVYPLVIGGTGVISVIYACDEAGLSLGFITSLCQKLPLYSMGFCWVSVSLVMLVISLAIGFIKSRKKPKKA